MSNQLYDYGRQSFLDGSVSWTTNNMKVSLLSSTYTFSVSHQNLSSVSGFIATSSNLTTKTATNGVADADDVTFTAVSGSQITQFIIFYDTGNTNTSRLIAYFDSATNLPLTPNGGDIIVQWDNGANKIFKL